MSMTASIDEIRSTFGPLVSQTARLWRRAVDQRLQPFGLTEATWLPLLRLSRARDPMRQKDLAAELSLDGSSIVRLLDELQSGGLVERREGADRRAKTIHLTRRGKAMVARVESLAAEVRRDLLAHVSDHDLRIAQTVLQQISDALSPAGAERDAGGESQP
jgi:MarR family transcriptional regulator for hemolysin